MKVGDGDSGKSNSTSSSRSSYVVCSRLNEWLRTRGVDWDGRSKRRRYVSRTRHIIFNAPLPSRPVDITTSVRPKRGRSDRSFGIRKITRRPTLQLCRRPVYPSPLRVPYDNPNERPESTPHMHCCHRASREASSRLRSRAPSNRNFPCCQVCNVGSSDAERLRFTPSRFPAAIRDHQQLAAFPIGPGSLNAHQLFPPRTCAEVCRVKSG